MDFPVEATVHLNHFPDETEVLRLLRSRGFELTDAGGGRVRVKGSFLELRDVKSRLEKLCGSRPESTPSSSAPVPAASSGAVSKYYSDHRTDGGRSRGRASSTPSSQRRPTSPSPDQQESLPPGGEQLVVDSDVFRYAQQLKKRHLDDIQGRHDVKMTVKEGGDSTSVCLRGRSSRMAVSQLQSLLNHLSQSLRTQEVTLRAVSPSGKALLDRIQKNGNISGPVLVRHMGDRLHLVGPSRESYELKLRLLERPVDQLGRRGRSADKSSRGRSSSLPPTNRMSSGGQGGAVGGSAGGGAGAAGFPPSPDGGQQGAAAQGQGGAPRRQSLSDYQEKKEVEIKRRPPKGPMKFFNQMMKFSPKKIKQKF